MVDEDILPHTFWNYIFVNKKEYETDNIEEELFTHELAHVTQKHTIDILLLEVMQIVLWINPFLLWLKKAVQLNHEFLADDTVISSHQNISYYQHLLLNKAAWNNKFYLASNLNYSLTKKRLLMMKTPSSKTTIAIKKLAILPLMAIAIFLFAERVEAQSKKKPIVIEGKRKSATPAQMKEYNNTLNKAVKSQMFKFDEIKRLRYLYSLMSEKQQKSVKNVYDFIPPPPPPAKVVKGTKTPPPPKPEKIIIKEVKSKKSNKDPKEVKEVIVIREKKAKKPMKEEEEEIIIEEIHEGIPNDLKEEEIEVIEVINESKESDWGSFEKRIGDPNYKKKIHQEKVELKLPEGKNITYFIDGAKVSKSKARRFVRNKKNKIKSVEVIKKDGTGKVYIQTQ